jgi:hypothetical protein
MVGVQELPSNDVPYRLSAAEGVNGALCFGQPLRVLTPEKQWEPVAIVPFEPVNFPPQTRFSVEMSVRVHQGSIALGILAKDGDGGDGQIVVDRADAWQQLSLATPPIHRAGPLIIRNASASGASRAQLRIIRTSPVSDKLVIFLHLPKTAGQSVSALLASALEPHIHISTEEAFRQFLGLSDRERAALRFAHGHMPYGLHRLVNQQCQYVVFLRNPVDRVVSAYYHIKQTPQHPVHISIRNGATLAAYATTFGESDNQQTRRLCQYDFLEILEPAKFDSYWWQKSQSRKLHLEDLEQAKDCLRACSFIGFQENFVSSARDLLRYLRLPASIEIPRINENLARPTITEIDPGTLDLILERNLFDLELYQFAQTLPAASRIPG